MNKCCVLLFATLVSADAFLITDIIDWRAYKSKHGKHYKNVEDDVHHFRIFVDQKHKIDEHNQHVEHGIATFRMGLNKYSDLKHKDYLTLLNGYDSSEE